MANITKRKYNLSDGDFAEKCDSVLGAATRDLAQLADFGITATRISDIETILASFKDFPDDSYYSGLMMEATAGKNTALENMTNLLQGHMARVRVKLGEKSSEYQGMNWDAYYKLSQSEKVHRARTLKTKLATLVAQLGSEGLTAAKITELADAITATDTALTEKDAAVGLRDNKAKERVDLGNQLYDLINGICEYGKEVWRDSDESKYNDYVLNPSPAQPHQVFNGTISAGGIVQPSVTIDSSSQQITIKNTGTQSFVAYCAAEMDDPLPPAAITITPGTEITKAAADLGYSTAAFRLLLNNSANTESTSYEGVVVG